MYEQYLNQLWAFKVPEEDFISAAQGKADKLHIDRSKAEAIWTKFIQPSVSPMTPQELEYEKYLTDLSTVGSLILKKSMELIC